MSFTNDLELLQARSVSLKDMGKQAYNMLEALSRYRKLVANARQDIQIKNEEYVRQNWRQHETMDILAMRQLDKPGFKTRTLSSPFVASTSPPGHAHSATGVGGARESLRATGVRSIGPDVGRDRGETF